VHPLKTVKNITVFRARVHPSYQAVTIGEVVYIECVSHTPVHWSYLDHEGMPPNTMAVTVFPGLYRLILYLSQESHVGRHRFQCRGQDSKDNQYSYFFSIAKIHVFGN